MKFKCMDWRERKQQTFDRKKITVTMAGNTMNVYDRIQEAREDTEIIPTLEKYGCIEGHMQVDPKKMYADFTGLTDLRGVLDAKIQAENLFYSLPLEEREHFNNDINQFTKNGEKYLKSKVEAFEKQQKLEEMPKTDISVGGVKENG